MSEEKRSARAETGRTRLGERGLDLGAASVADLEAAIATDAATEVAAAELLGDRVSAESAAALARLEAAAEARSDKELRRVVRRSLYRLAQRGVAPEASAPATAAPAPSPTTNAEAFLSPLDPTGDRLVWIIKQRPGGIWHLSAVVNEPAGLKEAMMVETTRKALRGLKGDLAKRHGLRMLEVDAAYADWIASEGFERARTAGTLPQSAAAFAALRLQLFTTPATPQPSPIAALLDAAALRGDRALLNAATSLFENDLRAWFLPPQAVTPYLQRVQEMRDSPIVLDRTQQRGRLEEIAGDAIDKIFAGDNRASWVRRLEEMAYVFAKIGKKDEAKALYANALALAESESGGRGIPFLETFVRRTFGLFLMEEAQREEDRQSSSVLVTPDQLRAEQAQARGGGSPLVRKG